MGPFEPFIFVHDVDSPLIYLSHYYYYYYYLVEYYGLESLDRRD